MRACGTMCSDVVLAYFSLHTVPPLGRLADVSDGEDKIPLQNVDARILAKVIEYMKYHYKLTETPQPEDEICRWDREFVRVDKSTLFHLVLVRFCRASGASRLCCMDFARTVDFFWSVLCVLCIDTRFVPWSLLS